MTAFFLIVSVLSLIGFVSTTNQKPCRTPESDWYNPETELCCEDKLTAFKAKRYKDELEKKCCGGTTYAVQTQICCGNDVLHKLTRDGKEIKCCGVNQYIPHENKKICCKGILHDKISDKDNCCGTFRITKGEQCCKKNATITEVHKKEMGKKCCGTDYFNKKTHYCSRKQTVLPKHHKLCGGIQYDTRKQTCCNGTLHKYSEDSQHYKCCGSQIYNTIDHKCCEGDGHLIPHDETCCGTTHYYMNTQRCCNGVSVTFSYQSESCCGKDLYDTRYQGCCGSSLFNTTMYECCRPDGDIVKKGTNEDCCGMYKYDREQHVCCKDYDDPIDPKFSVKQKDKSFHDECCTTSMQSYSSTSQICSLNGTIIPKFDMCGDKPYNTSIDLCCSGVLDERGEEKGRKCCGVDSYYTASQICCQNKVYFLKDKQSCKEDSKDSRKRRRELKVTESKDLYQNYGICQYCYLNTDEMIKVLKAKKDFCKHKALKIRVLKEYVSINKVIVVGSLRKDLFSKAVYRKNSINIQLPCPCKLDTPTAILLTDIEDYSEPVRLGDSDMIVGWTKKINNRIRRLWQICEKDETKLAIDYVSKIKNFVDFTSTQLKRKDKLR